MIKLYVKPLEYHLEFTKIYEWWCLFLQTIFMFRFRNCYYGSRSAVHSLPWMEYGMISGFNRIKPPPTIYFIYLFYLLAMVMCIRFKVIGNIQWWKQNTKISNECDLQPRITYNRKMNRVWSFKFQCEKMHYVSEINHDCRSWKRYIMHSLYFISIVCNYMYEMTFPTDSGFYEVIIGS